MPRRGRSCSASATERSTEFVDWWADHEVLRRSHGTKRYHHPAVGELTVAYEALPLPDDTDQVLFLYTAEPGSPSAQALQLLASWTLPGAGVPQLPRPATGLR